MIINKKAKCRITSFLTTPIWAYLIAIICALLFFCLSLALHDCTCCDRCNWWSAFFLNIGYGTIASVGVTMLIDIGNTKRQHNKDKKAFDRLNADLKELCAELPSEMYTAVYEARGYNENSKHTFAEWTNRLFCDEALNNKKHEKECAFILQHISLIRNSASQLKSDFKYLSDNQYIDLDYKQKLGRLISVCSQIARSGSNFDYAVCARVINKELKRAIVELYNELSIDYSRFYNEEDYDN